MEDDLSFDVEVNDDVYEGERNDEGDYHGRGVLQFAYGTYEGEFVKGKFHGSGELRLKNGNIYIGEFVHGKQEGRGKMVYADGRRYEGNLRQGAFHIYGEEHRPESVYKGDYYTGQRWGYGELIMRGDHPQAGWSYLGNFVKSLYEGEGVLTADDGTVYQCDTFKRGELHGRVIVTRGRTETTEMYDRGECIRQCGKRSVDMVCTIPKFDFPLKKLGLFSNKLITHMAQKKTVLRCSVFSIQCGSECRTVSEGSLRWFV